MSIPTHTQRRALACLLAAVFAAPCSAQSLAADPQASVPETRYQPAHVGRAPTAATTTPDRTWQENNRIVAGQTGHAGHAAHSPAAAPAAPAAAPAADPHAHHHDHHDHPAPAAPKGHH